MSEILAHAVGDYIVQSDWMASEKTKRHLPAAAHAASYAACFLPVTRNWRAILIIGTTHFVIDRWRLAKYLCWAKNQAAPVDFRYPFDHADGTGYHSDTLAPYAHDETTCRALGKPMWLSGWLMIIADNTIHMLINRWAIRRYR